MHHLNRGAKVVNRGANVMNRGAKVMKRGANIVNRGAKVVLAALHERSCMHAWVCACCQCQFALCVSGLSSKVCGTLMHYLYVLFLPNTLAGWACYPCKAACGCRSQCIIAHPLLGY